MSIDTTASLRGDGQEDASYAEDMDMIKDQILELASELSPEDLRELAQHFDEAANQAMSQEEIDASWVEEIQRRREAIRNGTAKMIPGDVVRRRLRRKNREPSSEL